MNCHSSNKNLSASKNFTPIYCLEELCLLKAHKEFSILSEFFLREDKWYHSGTEQLRFHLNLELKDTQFYC